MDDLVAYHPIEMYLARVQKRLHRRLPADQVQAVLDEARMHLTERMDELLIEGMAQEQAVATAIAAFGPADEWARGVIRSAFSDAGTRKARACAICAAILGLFASSVWVWLDGRASLIFPTVVIAALGLAAGSFRARQPMPLLLLAMGLTAAVLGFCASAWTQVALSDRSLIIPRAYMGESLKQWTLQVADTRQEVELLRLGTKTYCQRTLPVPVPTPLRALNGYIVPVPRSTILPGTYTSWWFSAFKNGHPPELNSRNGYTVEKILQVKAQTPYQTVVSMAEAARAWQTDAPEWQKEQEEQLRREQKQLEGVQAAAARPAGLDAEAGLMGAAIVGVMTIFGLALNWIAAGLGQQVFRLRKRKHLLPA